MIKFLKEKGVAILLLSVIFTFGTLLWTSDIVNNQNDLSSVNLGWPINFVSQNHSQKDPPEWWFPNNIGFGLPQEYSTSIYFLPFIFSTAINFFIILDFIFIVLKFNPSLRLLRKIISVKYIVSSVGLAFLLLISFLILDNPKRISQMGVGVPPPEVMLPTLLPTQDMEIVIDFPPTIINDMVKPLSLSRNINESVLELPWREAIEPLRGGYVRQISQSHNLEVVLMLKNGRIIKTIEPSIDEIFRKIEKCGKICKNVGIATQ